MPSFISDEDCSWPPIREHEGNIVFDTHTPPPNRGWMVIQVKNMIYIPNKLLVLCPKIHERSVSYITVMSLDICGPLQGLNIMQDDELLIHPNLQNMHAGKNSFQLILCEPKGYFVMESLSVRNPIVWWSLFISSLRTWFLSMGCDFLHLRVLVQEVRFLSGRGP